MIVVHKIFFKFGIITLLIQRFKLHKTSFVFINGYEKPSIIPCFSFLEY